MSKINIPTFGYSTSSCREHSVQDSAAREIEVILHNNENIPLRTIEGGAFEDSTSTNSVHYWGYRGLVQRSSDSVGVWGCDDIDVMITKVSIMHKDAVAALDWLKQIVAGKAVKPSAKVLRQQKLKFKYKQGSRYVVRGVQTVEITDKGVKYVAKYSRNGIQINETVVVPFKDLESVQHQHPTKNYKTYIFKYSKLVQVIEDIK